MRAVNTLFLVYDRAIVLGDTVTVTFEDATTLTGVLKFYYPEDQIWVIDETGVAIHYVKAYTKISKLVV